MRKHNTISKKLKKQFLSINSLIESYFDNIKTYLSYKNKLTLLKNKLKNSRVFLTIATLVILSLTILLMPTFYNKMIIESKIKDQIFKNYGISLSFKNKLIYGLFPKPHFIANDLIILNDKKEIANIEKLKIFIGIEKFFSINEIEAKDLIFKNVEFNINKGDVSFFSKLLKTEPNENKIEFKNSNIFFKNQAEEILFINKIDNAKFYYDAKNLENVLISKNEIFNLPFKIKIRNNKFNKNINSKFSSKKIRLVIKNDIDYSESTRSGLLDILFVNKSTLLNYEINKNFLKFYFNDNKEKYNGKIDFKPFYLLMNLNYEGLSSKNLFKNDSIVSDLIKSELLDNKNLNANINLSVKNITNVDELNNLLLKLNIIEGQLNFSNSSLMWKKDFDIILNESFLVLEDDNIKLIGKIILDFKNVNNFYKSFQIKKKNKKDIKKIELDFVYNASLAEVSFDNAKIDGAINEMVDKYINNFNSSKKRINNKITFKNFVGNFFEAYAG